jgi:hypothetical protein
MFAIVAVNFEVFQALPPFEFKLMAAVLRYVNRQGECCPALHQLAADVVVSEATVSRAMARLEGRGCFTRERQGNGRYLYRIAERFLPRRSKKPKIDGSPAGPSNRPHLAAVQDGLSHGARQEVAPSGSKEPSGEQAALSEGEIPSGWEEAAAAERCLAGLGPVNLRAEWRKLVAYSEGQRITIWRWRGWVLKALWRTSARTSPISVTPAHPATSGSSGRRGIGCAAGSGCATGHGARRRINPAASCRQPWSNGAFESGKRGRRRKRRHGY